MQSLTVILANYNHARYIPDSLGSLFAQTRPADELIIIDDKSTDDSVAVISSMIDGMPKVRFEQNPQNLGYVASVNRFVASARGDILFFAGADDLFYPTLFEKALKLLAENPAAAMFSARSDLVDADGGNRRLFDTPVPIDRPGYISPSRAAGLLMRDDSWFMGNVSLYRKDAHAAAGGLALDLGSLADGYISRVLALRHGVCFTPEVLGAWRRLDAGMAGSHAGNLDQVKAMIAQVQRKMDSHGSLFPTGYASRWGARHLFGAYRAAMARRARSLTGMRRWLAMAGDSFRVAWLFARYRPFDLVTVVARKIAGLTR